MRSGKSLEGGLDTRQQRGLRHIAGVNRDPDGRHVRQDAPGEGGKGQRRGGARRRPARPCDHRSSCKNPVARTIPDSPVILGDGQSGPAQGSTGTCAIKPGRRNETGCRTADHVFHQRLAVTHAGKRRGFVQSQEFAFSGSHMAGLEPGRPLMNGPVLVKPAMDEHFDPGIRPFPEPRLKRPVFGQGMQSPMVRHHEHGKARPAEMPLQPFRQLQDSGLRARPDVVYGGKQAFLRRNLGHLRLPVPYRAPCLRG